MATEIMMPALSPTMEKGTLARWLVGPGDIVQAGDPLAEIETDKATMELEAPDSGCIVALITPEGSADVAVGTPIALIGRADEGVDARSETPQPEAAVPAESAAEPVLSVAANPASEIVIATQPLSPAEPDQDVLATPLARRIAQQKGIGLRQVHGSGPRSKIVVADLGVARAPLALAAEAPRSAPPAAAKLASAPFAVAPPPAGVPVHSTPLSTMRKTIARRLTESKQTVPHFYLTARCQLDALLKLRTELNGALAPQGVKLSVNDLLIKAMALALTKVPDANVQFGGDVIYHFERVDVAMAVAIDGGLVTPVLRDVGALSLSGIARASQAVSARAREGRLVPDDYTGGTATISNLGMFGIDEMFPVINPPQALILGIGAGIIQPWNVSGEMALATIIAATASFDHRAIDGAMAARFMQAFRDLVECPLLLAA